MTTNIKVFTVSGHRYSVGTSGSYAESLSSQPAIREHFTSIHGAKPRSLGTDEGRRARREWEADFQDWWEDNSETLVVHGLLLDNIATPMNGAPKLSAILSEPTTNADEVQAIWDFFTNRITQPSSEPKQYAKRSPGNGRAKRKAKA